MSQIVKSSDEADAISAIKNLILNGDLSKLSEIDKLNYYKNVCTTVGLNPLTKPFEFMKLNGREVLYAGKNCAEQLRKNHGISVEVVSRESVGDSYIVCSKATDPTGRYDTSIGAVSIAGLKGEALANAIMKAETKSKRRVTLSIVGLGILDETEVESIPNQNNNNTITIPSKKKELLSNPINEVIKKQHEELIKLCIQKGVDELEQQKWLDKAGVEKIYELDDGKVFNLIQMLKTRSDKQLDSEDMEAINLLNGGRK